MTRDKPPLWPRPEPDRTQPKPGTPAPQRPPHQPTPPTRPKYAMVRDALRVVGAVAVAIAASMRGETT